jgi:hypothetical protein
MRAQISLHLIVRTKKAKNHLLWRNAKQDAQIQTRPAFKEIATQFTNPKAAVLVRFSENAG